MSGREAEGKERGGNVGEDRGRDERGQGEKEKLEGAPGTVASDITTINVTEVISHNKRN